MLVGVQHSHVGGRPPLGWLGGAAGSRIQTASLGQATIIFTPSVISYLCNNWTLPPALILHTMGYC